MCYNLFVMKKGQNIKISQIIKEFWKGIKPNKTLFYGSFLLLFLAEIVTIFVPIYYKKFFDALGIAGDQRSLAVPMLVKVIIIIGILHLLDWIFTRIGMLWYNSMESKAMAQLKQKSFDYMSLHSYSFFANNFSGSLVQRVNRFSRSFEILCDVMVFNIMPIAITIVGSIIITWFIAPIISFVIIGWVILFLTFNLLFSRWKLKYDVAVSESDSKTTGYLADAITNNNAVSFFTGYNYESKGFKNVSDDQARKTRFSWLLGEISNGTQGFMIIVVEFFVFYYGIKYWESGLATIGVFVLAQTYIIGLAQQLWGLNNVVRRISESIADSKEMVDILLTPYEISDIPDAKKLVIQKGEIIFKNVYFNFNETREVLSDINITIKHGEKIAIIGLSGAGKTTFVRLIMRLYDVTKGSIMIDDQDIHTVTQDSLREYVGFVPQDPILFHRTLMDNIRYGRRDATDEEVMHAAHLAHCDEFIDNLPLKYNTFVGERGIKLSGGERQRIAIARAILKKAPIFILDEATSSLDSHSEFLIQDALDNLMHDCTTIVIAHRLSTIKKMDRIIAIKDGKIVEEGTHNELVHKRGGLYKKLWDLQVSGFIQD
jgi:ATP-binding cassette subfamily B protein